MRAIAIVLFAAACGAQPDKPMLANAPRPDPGAVAGVAAAAAAAVTLANPNATQTPEKRDPMAGKQPVEVKEHVTPGVLDRLDANEAGSAAGSAAAAAQATKPAPKKAKGKAAKIPSPHDAAAAVGPANESPDAVPAQ